MTVKHAKMAQMTALVAFIFFITYQKQKKKAKYFSMRTWTMQQQKISVLKKNDDMISMA